MTFEKLITQKLDKDYISLFNYAFTASRRYKRYEIVKRNGGMRTIHHPSKELKIYQRFIADHIFLKLPIHDAVFSYRKNVSIKDLANQHKNNRFLLRIDFKDFFPSIKGENIRELLKRNKNQLDPKITDKDITIINMLVCKNNKLTIGAPSSPVISNVILYDFDESIKSKCTPDIVYSRYADDLYFSTNIPDKLTDIPKIINNYLASYHIKLKINNNKTIFTSKKHKRIITGLNITTENTISIGRKQKRYIKSLVFKYKNTQLESEKLIYLKGYLSYINSVDLNFIISLRNKYGAGIIERLMKNIQ